jgi:hypothetical protein
MNSNPPMQLPARLSALLGTCRVRVFGIGVALFVAPAALLLGLAMRSAAMPMATATTATAAAAACVLVGGYVVHRRLQRFDAAWLIRRLNAAVPDFEDSVALLATRAPHGSHNANDNANDSNAGNLTDLAALQRRRLLARLSALALPDLRPAIPWRTLAAAWLSTGAWLLGAAPAPRPAASRAVPTAHAPAAVELSITPPAYTHLPMQHATSWDVTVPSGSSVAFALDLGAATGGAALSFDDGSRSGGAERLRLERSGAVWRAVQVVSTTWQLEFEARDDYGLGAAELEVSLAHTTGDNVKTTQRKWVLAGSGNARERTYREVLRLRDFGFAKGDDLVATLQVTDNRAPVPNTARSASYILRFAPEAAADAAGMEGAVQKVTPAYLRSERQIIIDSEALLAARPTLDAAKFASRSDSLGVDQKMLRLRYGQFLGEEFENHADEAPGDARADGGTASGGGPGSGSGADAVVQRFGHVHDQPEAATLLEPGVKQLLRAALGEMWQAELHLRQADPQSALPYAYKALDYIKQVQQSERIYLARARRDVPESDPTRRLTGDRAALTDRAAPATLAQPAGAALDAAWRTLQSGGVPDVAALTDWVRTAGHGSAAGLDVLQAADRLQRDPVCGECRAVLAARLWSQLAVPPAAIALRPASNAAGAAYLNALQAPADGGPTPGPQN